MTNVTVYLFLYYVRSLRLCFPKGSSAVCTYSFTLAFHPLVLADDSQRTEQSEENAGGRGARHEPRTREHAEHERKGRSRGCSGPPSALRAPRSAVRAGPLGGLRLRLSRDLTRSRVLVPLRGPPAGTDQFSKRCLYLSVIYF